MEFNELAIESPLLEGLIDEVFSEEHKVSLTDNESFFFL